MTSKAAGDNTILVGPTGCMYVANSSYLCTPYNVPWAHTQIGSAGSFTAGVAAAYEAMIRKGKWKGKFPEHHLRGGRRQRFRHRPWLGIGRALSQPRLPDHLLRQRAVRQHRHPGLVAHAVRRDDDVLAARTEGSGSEDALPEGSGAHDGSGSSSLLRRNRERRLSDRSDEQGAEGSEPQGRRVHPDLHTLPEGFCVRDASFDRSRTSRRRMRHVPGVGMDPQSSAPTTTASVRRVCAASPTT